MRVGLKICGVTRTQDLVMCRELGVDAVGINLWPGSKRGLTLSAAASMVKAAGAGGPQRVGVFVQAPVEQVREAIEPLKLDAIQLHWEVDPTPYAALGVPWIQVVRGTPDLDMFAMASPAPDRILLDALVPGFGGAGRRTDWAWAQQAVRRLRVPVWLAGGLTVDNAPDAIATVHPAGLDVASGAERDDAPAGEKDRDKVEGLLRACGR